MFPDSVTLRGRRHLEELARLAKEGMKSAVLFIAHLPGVRFFMPDYHTDLAFAETFLRVRNDVELIPVSVTWHEDLNLSSEARLLKIPWEYIEREARDRGSYLVLLRMQEKRGVRVGSLGSLPMSEGFYIYVGSAMTNLSRRMERHRRLRKSHHWHIDNLRAIADVHSLLAIRSSERLECEIASALSKIAEWKVPGFGASDCDCNAHLFGFSVDPLLTPAFQDLLIYFRMDRNYDQNIPDFSNVKKTRVFP